MYAISITFTVHAKDHLTAVDLAEQIGVLAQQEDLANEYSLIDVEELDVDIVEEIDLGDDE